MGIESSSSAASSRACKEECPKVWLTRDFTNAFLSYFSTMAAFYNTKIIMSNYLRNAILVI